jgi:ferredoxin
MKYYKVFFPGTAFLPISVPEGANLSEYLNAINSPILFGCRSGLCGSCTIEVDFLDQELPLPQAKEREVLDVYAPGNPKARLACQLKIQTDLVVRWIKT